MPCGVASQISPSGMTLAGKHGIGIISIGSLSEEGLNALPTQWSFAEDAAAKHGQTVDRRNWRGRLGGDIAETPEKGGPQAPAGPLAHPNKEKNPTPPRAPAPGLPPPPEQGGNT